MPAPDPNSREPVAGQPRVRYLREIVTSPLILAGEYSYYDDPVAPERFERDNVLYHYGPERLIVGRFCSIATGVRFIMNGANHRLDGISAFPFPIFGGDWAPAADLLQNLPNRGDTVVGNDVWLGFEATIAPGIVIGDGAIVAARAVVTKNVRPYAIVAGNPAVEVRRRYDDATIARLANVAWWDWPIERVTAHVREIMSGTVDSLERAT